MQKNFGICVLCGFIVSVCCLGGASFLAAQQPNKNQPTQSPLSRFNPLSKGNAANDPANSLRSPVRPKTPVRPGNRRPNQVPAPTPSPSQRLAAQAAAQKASSVSSCQLKSSRHVGSTDIIEVILEASGDILQTESQSETVSEEKMELVAGFRYEERTELFSLTPNAPLRSVRQYEQAGMKRKFGNTMTRPLLDSSRKNILCDYNGKKVTICSPSGPLKSDQFLLLDELPGNSLLLDQFLPNKTVQLGEEWQVADEIVAAILGLETIENNTLHLVLTAIIDDIAEVEIFLTGGKDASGQLLPSSIEGAYLGASVSIDLEGKFQFDLKEKRMTWFGLLINERRSESLVEPGLDWTASLRVKIAPLPQPEKLNDGLVSTINVEPTDEFLRLFYNGQRGPWQFYHSRNWRMIEDGDKTAALCLVVKGDGVAQCNILSNGRIDRATLPTMEDYKKELQKGLGDRFGAFVREAKYVNDAGYDTYAVIADGQFEEIPFRWIYYLMTDEYGNQTTLMFEIRADQIEQFDQYSQEIIESFRMIPETSDLTHPENTASEDNAADAESDETTGGIEALKPQTGDENTQSPQK